MTPQPPTPYIFFPHDEEDDLIPGSPRHCCWMAYQQCREDDAKFNAELADTLLWMLVDNGPEWR